MYCVVLYKFELVQIMCCLKILYYIKIEEKVLEMSKTKNLSFLLNTTYIVLSLLSLLGVDKLKTLVTHVGYTTISGPFWLAQKVEITT